MSIKHAIILIFILIFHSSCTQVSINGNGVCPPITSKDIYGSAPLHSFQVLLRNGQTATLIDKGFDSLRAGIYDFYENDNLKSYSFFVDSNTYTYKEDYDSSGKVYKLEGSPLVYKKVKFVTDDSVFIKLYLFSLQKEYNNLSANTSTGKVISLDLQQDSSFSNMKYSEFGFNLGTKNSFQVYLNGELKSICSGWTEKLRDTIDLKNLN
ncbi:MAG: hypothetical protein EOO43_26205 [Flavobacterium sp.]|nr:MAG: hypothetical protein EOO43_26205 [Flavobacterium sp.]